jgi:membrane protease YdiL (CAAX protease family)
MPDLPPTMLATVMVLAIATLALGAPPLLRRVPRGPAALAGIAAAMTACYVLASWPRFDPYWTAIVAATTAGALFALADVPAGAPLGGTDIVVWLLLWIPFDLRWNKDFFGGDEGIAYNWCAFYLVVLGAIAWGRVRELPGFDYRLAPRLRDLAPTLPAYVGVLVLCVPAGLATGFVHWPGVNFPATVADGLKVSAVAGPAIFLTIALPEELFFRCVLQGGLERRLKRPIWALLVASLAFGLMHWNNSESTHGLLRLQLVYFGLATIAGVIYGLAYRRGGSILASAIVHTLVDLSWHLFFQAS